MTLKVSSIRNLGPASDAAFARAGIHSAEQLHKLGPDVAYAKLLASGTRAHFIGYYALVMGLQARPWNDCKGKEKVALRIRFDAIKSEAAAKGPDDDLLPAELGAMLDKIGVRSS